MLRNICVTAMMMAGAYLPLPASSATGAEGKTSSTPQSTAPRQDEQAIDPVGDYRVTGVREMLAQIQLNPDGQFRFALIVGAMDLWSQGKWNRNADGTVNLLTLPRPVAPEIKPAHMVKKAGAPISIHISTPNGRGIAGVDFVIGFDDGETIEHYTQSDGWQSEPDEKRTPRWIALHEPIYDIILEKTDIPDGANDLRFTLTPNDVGVLDFNNATARLHKDEDGDTIMKVVLDKGEMTFVKDLSDEEMDAIIAAEANEENDTPRMKEPIDPSEIETAPTRKR